MSCGLTLEKNSDCNVDAREDIEQDYCLVSIPPDNDVLTEDSAAQPEAPTENSSPATALLYQLC